MSATDPQAVLFWDENRGPRFQYSGHWYKFLQYIPEPEPRWLYVPENSKLLQKDPLRRVASRLYTELTSDPNRACVECGEYHPAHLDWCAVGELGQTLGLLPPDN